jgi:LPS sulfotransferase NodH
LEKTGIAGRPAEVFAPDFRGPWFDRWHLSPGAPFSEYLAAARRHGTGRNGVFGVKLQYMHVSALANWALESCDTVLDRLFPGAAFINLVRQDRRAQALSWFRAIRTNKWFKTDPVRADPAPELDPRAVLDLEAHLAWQQSAWEQHFAKRGIRPLTIQYESLASDHRAATARVLAFLGLDPHAADSSPEPVLVSQADEVTAQWRRIMDGATRASGTALDRDALLGR